jgi:hypothetical protein
LLVSLLITGSTCFLIRNLFFILEFHWKIDLFLMFVIQIKIGGTLLYLTHLKGPQKARCTFLFGFYRYIGLIFSIIVLSYSTSFAARSLFTFSDLLLLQDNFRNLLLLKPYFQLHQLEEIKELEITGLFLLFWLMF